MAALQARLTLRATVVRDGAPQEVPIHDVVRERPRDAGAGDIVPADGRILDANHLYVDESSLTGESAPPSKAPRDAGDLGSGPRPTIATALVFFGTSVVSGTGRAVITATGDAHELRGDRAPPRRARSGERLPARRPRLRGPDLPRSPRSW